MKKGTSLEKKVRKSVIAIALAGGLAATGIAGLAINHFQEKPSLAQPEQVRAIWVAKQERQKVETERK